VNAQRLRYTPRDNLVLKVRYVCAVRRLGRNGQNPIASGRKAEKYGFTKAFHMAKMSAKAGRLSEASRSEVSRSGIEFP
jgi:hypothetical protein